MFHFNLERGRAEERLRDLEQIGRALIPADINRLPYLVVGLWSLACYCEEYESEHLIAATTNLHSFFITDEIMYFYYGMSCASYMSLVKACIDKWEQQTMTSLTRDTLLFFYHLSHFFYETYMADVAAVEARGRARRPN